MTDQKNLKNLLQGTQVIIKHHNELAIAKGEHFNLFSVLKIEARENNTHSSFLAELLNPKGSHRQGAVFLSLFLKVISKKLKHEEEGEGEEEEAITETSLVDKFINTALTKVITEFHIDNINVKNKTGGRIDILLKNGNNFICIENKIIAGDQEAQIQRYCNFESETNTVFYLTLEGKNPHINSRGKKKVNEDFYNISYREDILEWLELCLREVPNLTSVREALNQYILLIKKLTHILNIEQKKELDKIMAKYIEEAAYISSNYQKMIADFKKNFRDDVKKKLEQKLNNRYSLTEGRPTYQKYSQLWINFKNHPKLGFKFGLESFSGNGHGFLFVGIRDVNKSKILATIPEEKRISAGWRHTRNILTEDGKEINFNHKDTLEILAERNGLKYKELVDSIVRMTIEFIEEYEKKLPERLFEASKQEFFNNNQ